MLRGAFPSALFTILAIVWRATEIDAQAGCTTGGLTRVAIDSHACDSYFSDGTNALCGPLDEQGAARACFDLGINHDSTNIANRRKFRCQPYVTDTLDDLVSSTTYAQIEGDVDYACDATASGDPDCFLNCYPATTALFSAANCGGQTVRTAVQCVDIDECTDGVLRDCTGPFDFDCVCGIPCGPGATCENNPGGYDCTCPDGYADTDADDITIGCVDFNECLVTTNNDCDDPTTEICENTIGSYYCLCKAADGLFRGDTADECDAGTCDLLGLPGTNDPRVLLNSNGWSGADEYNDIQTTVCDDGFEPSLSNSNPVSTECRNDGKWCQCNPLTCQRKRCGIPHHDGNAYVDTEVGVTGDTLTYECLDGFKAGVEDEYEILCENSGAWEGVDLRCTDDNECSDPDICEGYSDCINTVGSYHCHCHPGFIGDDCDERISCGEIPIVAHAERLSPPDDTVTGEYEMVVNYRCEEGYHVSTNHNPHEVERDFDITCKLDKCWTPSPIPHCVPISCGDPGDLKHASREGGSFHYKSKVSYTCCDGFELPGHHTTEFNKVKTFEMTCEKNGWTEKQYCEDIDECKDYAHPCGVGGRHHCINRKGSYTCSCAPGFRLDKTGQQCIGLPTGMDIQDISDPCEVFRTLGFCKHGHCALDGAGTPRCSCDAGFRGTFCDRGEPMDHSLAYITAIVDVGIGALSLIVVILLACCICSRQHHPRSRRRHGHHHSTHPVVSPPAYVRHAQTPTPFQVRFQGPLQPGFFPQLSHSH